MRRMHLRACWHHATPTQIEWHERWLRDTAADGMPLGLPLLPSPSTQQPNRTARKRLYS